MSKTKTATVSLKKICSDDYLDQNTIESKFQGNVDEELDERIEALSLDIQAVSNYVSQLFSDTKLPEKVELYHDGTEYRVLSGQAVVTAYAYAGKNQLPAIVHSADSIETPAYKGQSN